jgi:hypothetical protein
MSRNARTTQDDAAAAVGVMLRAGPAVGRGSGSAVWYVLAALLVLVTLSGLLAVLLVLR